MAMAHDIQDLPGWFHGTLSRRDAEALLHSYGISKGLFLVRESGTSSGYAVTLCTGSGNEIVHYQIRYEAVDGTQYLTFDTETSAGPKFHSLVSVVNHLLRNPGILDAPLRVWCPATPLESDYLSPNELYASRPKEARRKPSFTSNISGAVSDALASQGTLTEDVLLASQTPGLIEGFPELRVFRRDSTRNPGRDTLTGESVTLEAGDILKLIKVEKTDTGSVFFICRDQSGRLLEFPEDSNLQVAPKRVFESEYADMDPPPVPDRSRTSSPKPGDVPRKKSLKDMMQDDKVMPLHQNLDMDSADHPTLFFREVIKEGYLSKLPPARNKFKKWRRRYFKLVISLHRSFTTGPVHLEYYAEANKVKAKGVIDLDNVTRVSMVKASGKYKGVSDESCLFEIELPNRIYPCTAESAEMAQEWVDSLRDILGLSPTYETPVRQSFSVVARKQYSGSILHKGVNNHEATLEISSKCMTLVCPDSRVSLLTWSYDRIREHGYLRQILWFEILSRSEEDKESSGLFCFSCTDAQEIYDSICHFADLATGLKRRTRFSRRENMSWSSVEGIESLPPKLPPRTQASLTTELFGKPIPDGDLEPVAYGLALKDYSSEREFEFSFQEGESMTIVASRAFLLEGFWIAQKQDSAEFGLVPVAYVQIHEHEFGNMRDFDDNLGGSKDSLLEGADPSLFNLDYGFPKAADPGDDDDVEQDYVYTAMDDPRCDAPYMNADAPMLQPKRSLYQTVKKTPKTAAEKARREAMQEEEEYVVPDSPIETFDEDGYADVLREPLPEQESDRYPLCAPMIRRTTNSSDDYVDANDATDAEAADYINAAVKGKHGFLPPSVKIKLPSGKEVFYEPPPMGKVSDLHQFIASMVKFPKFDMRAPNVDLSNPSQHLHSFHRISRLDVDVIRL